MPAKILLETLKHLEDQGLTHDEAVRELGKQLHRASGTVYRWLSDSPPIPEHTAELLECWAQLE